MTATLQHSNKHKLSEAYRVPLCPYLTIGNGKMLLHMDAYCVPQSMQWPFPGSPDRLGWRDPADEWPYWDEISEDVVRSKMSYFEYSDGSRDYLHESTNTTIDYIPSTNILQGSYDLPHGAKVNITTFVAPNSEVWVRQFNVEGNGVFVHQSEFFEKAVRGHRMAYLGHVDFRGIFDGPPRGIYVIMGSQQLNHTLGRVEIEVDGNHTWSVYLSAADDLKAAVAAGERAQEAGFDNLLEEATEADRAWVSRAKKPSKDHPFIQKHYKRWLLGNKICFNKESGMLAGPRPFWSFTWPRDSALNIAGFASAGYLEEARQLLKWNLSNTPDSAIHEARYYPDGSPVLLDNRLRQGDNPGFLSWAASFVCQQEWDEVFAHEIKDTLYQLGDLMVNHVDEETKLPYPEADYMEGLPSISISNVISSIGGLIGIAWIADKLGDHDVAELYKKRAATIKRAAKNHMWNEEGKFFIRSIKPLDDNTDIIVALGAFPYRAWQSNDETILDALSYVKEALWNKDDPGSMWFYHKAKVLLGMAGIGDIEMEKEIVDTLENDVCPQGLIPEQLNRKTGHLAGCSYLTTAQSCMLIYAYMNNETLIAQESI